MKRLVPILLVLMLSFGSGAAFGDNIHKYESHFDPHTFCANKQCEYVWRDHPRFVSPLKDEAGRNYIIDAFQSTRVVLRNEGHPFKGIVVYADMMDNWHIYAYMHQGELYVFGRCGTQVRSDIYCRITPPKRELEDIRSLLELIN